MRCKGTTYFGISKYLLEKLSKEFIFSSCETFLLCTFVPILSKRYIKFVQLELAKVELND